MNLIIFVTGKENRLVLLNGEMELVKELEWAGERDELKKLMPKVSGILGECGASFENVEVIGVLVGPGDFSATRIAVTVANGLASGLGVKLVELKLDELNELGLVACFKEKVKKELFVQCARPVYAREAQITLSNKPKFY